MADALRPYLPKLDREGYARFLSAMVHYTRGSGARLRHAGAHAPSEALRAFFSNLAVEEDPHHTLAEADLKALGGGRRLARRREDQGTSERGGYQRASHPAPSQAICPTLLPRPRRRREGRLRTPGAVRTGRARKNRSRRPVRTGSRCKFFAPWPVVTGHRRRIFAHDPVGTASSGQHLGGKPVGTGHRCGNLVNPRRWRRLAVRRLPARPSRAGGRPLRSPIRAARG